MVSTEDDDEAADAAGEGEEEFLSGDIIVVVVVVHTEYIQSTYRCKSDDLMMLNVVENPLTILVVVDDTERHFLSSDNTVSFKQ